MDINQCFRILNISPYSTIEEVKQAYRDQVNICHPDRFVNDSDCFQKEAEERTKCVNIAYKKIITYISLEQERIKGQKKTSPNAKTYNRKKADPKGYRKEHKGLRKINIHNSIV